MTHYDTNKDERLDKATSERLHALRYFNNTASNDNDFINRILLNLQDAPHRKIKKRFKISARYFSIAASITIASMIMVVVMFGSYSNDVNAGIINLQELHYKLAESKSEVYNIQDLNKELKNQIKAALTESVPSKYIESCCLKDVNGMMLASVNYQNNGQTISVVIAQGEEFAMPMGEVEKRSNVTMYKHTLPSNKSLKMVMVKSQDRWLCVMGETAYQRLIETASSLDFK
ncbi:hypothetical protein JD969_18795 [Planctomycetota bacterium]|nr:hypothetical protein JD969_18795 [Planctomycetota bacterium]